MSPPGGAAARLPPRPPAARSFVNKYGGGHANVLWLKFTHFESKKNALEHFLDTVTLQWVGKMPTKLAPNFVNAGSVSKNVSLPRDIKYMGVYGRSPGMRKYFVAAGISYQRDFVIAGFDCTCSTHRREPPCTAVVSSPPRQNPPVDASG